MSDEVYPRCLYEDAGSAAHVAGVLVKSTPLNPYGGLFRGPSLVWRLRHPRIGRRRPAGGVLDWAAALVGRRAWRLHAGVARGRRWGRRWGCRRGRAWRRSGRFSARRSRGGAVGGGARAACLRAQGAPRGRHAPQVALQPGGSKGGGIGKFGRTAEHCRTPSSVSTRRGALLSGPEGSPKQTSGPLERRTDRKGRCEPGHFEHAGGAAPPRPARCAARRPAP